jgi:hypothetical protein
MNPGSGPVRIKDRTAQQDRPIAPVPQFVVKRWSEFGR